MPFLSPGMYPEHRRIDALQNMLIFIRKPILSKEINSSKNMYRESMKLKTLGEENRRFRFLFNTRIPGSGLRRIKIN
jgi:hypothetical protein